MAFFGVTIEEIETVSPIEGADRIQVATVKGLVFNFVIGKDSFKPGDKVLYFPIDSLIPQTLAEKLGVAGKLAGKNKDRVKTVTLKGVVSQGLVGSISLIEGLDDRSSESITQFLGVTKYEPPEVVCHGGTLIRHAEGVSTYDIEGADRYPVIIDKLMDQPVFITEKVEGSNWYGGVDAAGSYVVGQRSGAIIPDDVNNPSHTWWKVAIEQKLLYAAYRIQADKYQQKSVIIRGEIAGGTIQGNVYKLPKMQIFAFDILVDGVYVDACEFIKLTEDYMIQTVPVLSTEQTLRNWLTGKTVKDASNGKSMLGDHLREGIVIKPMAESYDRVLGGRLFIKQRDPLYQIKTGL